MGSWCSGWVFGLDFSLSVSDDEASWIVTFEIDDGLGS